MVRLVILMGPIGSVLGAVTISMWIDWAIIQGKNKMKAKERHAKWKHCSYCYSDFYLLIPHLMSSIESYLSNKPKQCI